MYILFLFLSTVNSPSHFLFLIQATSQVEESERKVELFRVSLEELLGMVSEQALNKRKPRTAPSALTGSLSANWLMIC